MKLLQCGAIMLNLVFASANTLEINSKNNRAPKGDSVEKEQAGGKGPENLRNQKLFSLFSIVTFPNAGCASQDAARNGTCFTSSECQDKGGIKSGNCAAGFGVCCLFIVTDTATTINQNCTYIQNPSFPSVYSSETALTYTINKCSCDVCSLRLDFESFSLRGPADTLETDGGACQDSLVISGTSGLSSPVICGLNSGQHVYMDMGAGCSDTATLAFTFSGSVTIRTWEIKATQIPCGAQYDAPDGCLQYHTTLSGRFQTFNFADAMTTQHLASQNYGVCIRQEEGYCCIQYTPCSDANSYSLSSTHATMAKQDQLCVEDYVGIAGVTTCGSGSDAGAVIKTRLCGPTGLLNLLPDGETSSLTSVCDCTEPFIVNIVTDATKGVVEDTQIQRGVCFDYTQLPC